MRRAALVVAVLVAALAGSLARGDGGAVVARIEVGESALVVFVAPVPPHAGDVELSFLLTHRGQADSTTPISFTASGPAGVARAGIVESAREGDRFARSALLALTEGEWVVDAQVQGTPSMRVQVAIAVGPAPPPWMSSLVWMLVWVPVAAIIIVRERLVRRQRAARGYP